MRPEKRGADAHPADNIAIDKTSAKQAVALNEAVIYGLKSRIMSACSPAQF